MPTDHERRGLDAFVRAGCPSCHAFPAFTNLGRHAARAVFPRARIAPGASLDTPSLRGVSRRHRFLHDGRADSLAAIFAAHDPDGRHGRIRALEAAARADLLVFLESL
jgi:cytochrome c peroxidase